ncbi:MAG: glycoside hydrolase family 36 protein [Bacteroidales bacterium]
MKNKFGNYLLGRITSIKLLSPRLFRAYLMCISLMLIIGVNACKEPESQEWTGIAVDVKADQAVKTSQKITSEEGGFCRLDITLSNQGTEIVNIDSIEIRIPITETLSDDMNVAYGSSCMGQRPVFVHQLGNPQSNSYSYMYSMLQLDDNRYIFAGSLSWRIFMPSIAQTDNAFIISSGGKGRQLKPGESIHYEQIVLTRSSDWQQLLDSFGSAIAKENGIEQLKDVNFKGWATWDYYAYIFGVDDIYENMEKLKEIAPTANLIQIDAGWYSQRGDFGQSRSDFPGGMKEVANQIKAAGMIPGVWIDGFRANTDSDVFKNHPEYFLHDQNENPIVRLMRPEGPDNTRAYFDYSHPGARAHMAECIRVIKEEMGITYFKVDFMRFGLEDEFLRYNPEVTSVHAYDPSITDVERMRMGLKVISEAVGSDNYLLGCSAVFGPCIGFVDGMRTGGDINPRFEAFPERLLANAGNSYLSGKVFNGDADYLVFREAADEDETVTDKNNKSGGSLSLNEAQMWADFNKLYGTCRLSGDKLTTLRPERLDMLTEVFDSPVMDETLPIDFWQHAKDKQDGYELILGHDGENIYLGIFNWSDKVRTYDLSAFESGAQTLQPRHSKVLKYSGSLSFKELGKSLSAGLY